MTFPPVTDAQTLAKVNGLILQLYNRWWFIQQEWLFVGEEKGRSTVLVHIRRLARRKLEDQLDAR